MIPTNDVALVLVPPVHGSVDSVRKIEWYSRLHFGNQALFNSVVDRRSDGSGSRFGVGGDSSMSWRARSGHMARVPSQDWRRTMRSLVTAGTLAAPMPWLVHGMGTPAGFHRYMAWHGGYSHATGPGRPGAGPPRYLGCRCCPHPSMRSTIGLFRA